jgi:hypothetical protein
MYTNNKQPVATCFDNGLLIVFGNTTSGQRRTRTDTLARMILSQLRLPIPPVALIYSLLIITHSRVI